MQPSMSAIKPLLVILTSSPLADRILLHTALLEHLCTAFEVEIWATSAKEVAWDELRPNVQLRHFPSVRGYWGLLLTTAKRIDDYAWTFATRNTSKLSMMRHLTDKRGGLLYRVCKTIGGVVAALGVEGAWDEGVRKLVVQKETSLEASERLKRRRPSFLLAMGPQLQHEPHVINSAKRLGIPIGAYITSWDNISTKGRLWHKMSAYFVWTAWMKEALIAEETSAEGRVYVVGAPQYDLFVERRHVVSREEFCFSHNLRADRPIVVAALGMANGINEAYLAEGVAKLLAEGKLGDVQLLVRPHPFFHSDGQLAERLSSFGPRVAVQVRRDSSLERSHRSVTREDVKEWLNTFRHANVVVHLCSTVAVDAALFDVPSVCLDFDPTPGGEKTALVKEINREWVHYRRVTSTGGTRLVGNWEEASGAIRMYLEQPEMDRDFRARMVEAVVGTVDGKSSQRLAVAIWDAYRSSQGKVRG